MKSILDPSFRYTPSVKTNIAKTFERIRREQRKAAQNQHDAIQRQCEATLRQREAIRRHCDASGQQDQQPCATTRT